MKQVTITYTRAITVTVPDDNRMGPEELAGCVDSMSKADLVEDFGVEVVDDETLNFSSCVTDIP